MLFNSCFGLRPLACPQLSSSPEAAGKQSTFDSGRQNSGKPLHREGTYDGLATMDTAYSNGKHQGDPTGHVVSIRDELYVQQQLQSEQSTADAVLTISGRPHGADQQAPANGASWWFTAKLSSKVEEALLVQHVTVSSVHASFGHGGMTTTSTSAR